MNRKGYTKMDHTVFYAEQDIMAGIGYPDAGWYWDFAGSDEPDPHGPFSSYEAALADKTAYLSFSSGVIGRAERAYYDDMPPF